MTTNPYAPPTGHGEGAPAPPEKSIPRRISIILAVAGFAVFWGTLAVCIVTARRAGQVTETAGLLMGVALVLAVVTHLVGVTIALAAVPEGRRLLPGLLNALSLGLVIGLAIFAMRTT